MRPFRYAGLFGVPFRDAIHRLDALADREERELVRLAPEAQASARETIVEIRDEARRLRNLMPR